jgi:hypothetical protein
MRSCLHCTGKLELRTIARGDGSTAQERVCRGCGRSSETPIAFADDGPPDVVRFPYGSEHIVVSTFQHTELGELDNEGSRETLRDADFRYFLSVRGNLIGSIEIDPGDTPEDVEARARQFLDLPDLST